MKRKIVEINEAKCNGCGICIDACHEGAIALVDGKAKLVSDIYCDGLGDCLGECPMDAIKIIEREAAAYDDDAVQERLQQQQAAHGGGGNGQAAASAEEGRQAPRPSGGCPGMRMLDFGKEAPAAAGPAVKERPAAAGSQSPPSALRQWPIQLSLVPVNAPYWEGADILVAADCVAHALGDFADRLLSGRRLVIACPKLDQRTDVYIEKLAAILQSNDVRSVTVAYMEVPCCHGMRSITEQAVAVSGQHLPVRTMKIGIQGDVLGD